MCKYTDMLTALLDQIFPSHTPDGQLWILLRMHQSGFTFGKSETFLPWNQCCNFRCVAHTSPHCDHRKPSSIQTLTVPPLCSTTLRWKLPVRLSDAQICSLLLGAGRKMPRLSRGTWMSSVLRIAVLCGSGVCAGERYADADEGDSGSESVFRARCVSRCLSLHSMAAPLTPLQVRTGHFVLVSRLIMRCVF